MSNIRKSYVETDILGEHVLLKFDFNAVAELEEYFDKGISQIFSQEQVGFRTIRAFYWIGMKWKKKSLTIEQTGNLLSEAIQNEVSLEDLMTPIQQGLKASGIIKQSDIVIDAEEVSELEGDQGKN